MKSKLIPVASLLLAIILVLPVACARETTPPEPGAEPKGEIVIGFLDDLSGPTGGITTPTVDGEKDAIRYVNEEMGGILGHPLRTIVIDYKMDAALLSSGWDRLKNEGAPIVMSYLGGLPGTVALSQRDHLPILASALTVDQGYPKEPSYVFGQSPHLAGLTYSTIKLIAEDWAKRGKTDTPKVALDIILWPSVKDIYTKAAKMEMEKRGWDYIITYTTMRPADVTTQVLQVKQFEPDYLFMIDTDTACIAWLKDLERQNIRPVIYGTTNNGSEEVWNAVGELAVGTTFYMNGPQWTETDSPIVSKLHELNSQWYPDVEGRPSFYIRGFAGFLVLAEAMKRAVENVGYDNLNGEAMKEAMETINDFEPMGFGTGWTWTPTDHHGMRAVKWYTWTKEGIIVPVTDWIYSDPLPEDQRTNSWWAK